MRIAMCVCVLSLLATPAWAHVNPKWCAEQKQKPPKDPVPGQLPGPAEHSKMNNIELGSFDLAKEIPGMIGRSVRTRFWMMEPGGIIAEHCHEDRPAFVYLLQGEVVETIEVKGKPVVRVLKAGQSVPEGNGTRHWWINQTNENVLMVAVDIPNATNPPRRSLDPVKSDKIEVRELDRLLLREQYPHIPEVAKYKVQGKLVTIRPTGQLGLTEHAGQPGITYVIRGILLEHRSDQVAPIVRRAGDVSTGTEGVSNYWENKSGTDATLLLVEFIACGDCQQ